MCFVCVVKVALPLQNFANDPALQDAVIAAQVVETNAIEDEGFNDPEVRARLGPMKERLQDRRVYMHSPMLGAAFATDPEFRKVDLLSVDGGGVLNDFKTMCTRILIDFKDDEDPEVTITESESLPDGGPVGRALAQLPRFKNKDWGGAAFLPSAKSMSVASWWQQYGRMDGFDEIAKWPSGATPRSPHQLDQSAAGACPGVRGFTSHAVCFAVCCFLILYLFLFRFLCLASFLPTRHMLSVCCHKYTKTHETLTNTVLCTLMQTSWEVGTLAWALIRQRSWSSCGPT